MSKLLDFQENKLTHVGIQTYKQGSTLEEIVERSRWCTSCLRPTHRIMCWSVDHASCSTMTSHSVISSSTASFVLFLINFSMHSLSIWIPRKRSSMSLYKHWFSLVKHFSSSAKVDSLANTPSLAFEQLTWAPTTSFNVH